LSIIHKLSGEICTFKQDSEWQTGHVKQSAILPVSLPYVYHFKNSFTSKQNDNSVLKQPPHLKCVATLPCPSWTYAKIQIYVSDYRYFLTLHVSQGSVATFVRCDGLFNYTFITNLLLSPLVKKFWISVSIWWSYGQKYSGAIFGTRCILSYRANHILLLLPIHGDVWWLTLCPSWTYAKIQINLNAIELRGNIYHINHICYYLQPTFWDMKVCNKKLTWKLWFPVVYWMSC